MLFLPEISTTRRSGFRKRSREESSMAYGLTYPNLESSIKFASNPVLATHSGTILGKFSPDPLSKFG